MKRRRSLGSSLLARARSFVPPWPRPRRKRADQTPLIDFCNRREDRAHPGATRYPVRRRVERERLAIEGRGRQGTGYPAGSRAPALPVASTRPSFDAKRERPARTEAGTLVGRESGRKPGEVPALLPCPKARLRPAARTVRPSDEPGYLLVARNRDSSPRPFAGSSGAERKRPFFACTTVRP